MSNPSSWEGVLIAVLIAPLFSLGYVAVYRFHQVWIRKRVGFDHPPQPIQVLDDDHGDSFSFVARAYAQSPLLVSEDDPINAFPAGPQSPG